jgi:hypothetical protein
MEELTVRYWNNVQSSSRSYFLTFNEREANGGIMCVREHFFLRKLRNIFPRFMKLKTEHNPTLLINFPTSITRKGRLWLTSIRAKLFKCWIYIVSLLRKFVHTPCISVYIELCTETGN